MKNVQYFIEKGLFSLEIIELAQGKERIQRVNQSSYRDYAQTKIHIVIDAANENISKTNKVE